jgi:mxaJ protein
MSFRFKTLIIGLAIAFSALASETNKIVLRVAADPNNLPFSNDKGEGFENRIAEMLARDLNADLQYLWRAQRRGFFRETLKENQSDLVMGVPAGFERAAPSKPYYASSYVFVTQRDRNLKLESLDDPRLRTLRVGVQIIGDDYGNPPPALALASRGIITNVTGYTLYGNYSEPNPPAQIVAAVARGEIDVGLVWGPLAGFFAARSQTPLDVRPIHGGPDDPPMAFSIAIGSRRKDKALQEKVNAFVAAHQPEIDRILEDFHIPRVTPPPRAERRDD